MIIRANDERIRYTGRWNIKGDTATSTANGNYFEFGFKGELARIAFKVGDCSNPRPHVYISVDNGALIDTVIDSYHLISCEDSGEHYVKVLMKSSMEKASRWCAPLESMVTLAGIEADEFYALPEDRRPKIEFIGDSITEGVAVDELADKFYADKHAPLHTNDSSADYAYVASRILNFRPYTMGYGRLGVCTLGNGDIPPVINSYGFYSDNEPMDSINADYIVINHGTNDAWAESDAFIKAYTEFLAFVRGRNPSSVIIALSPFGGFNFDEIETSVKSYNEQSGDNVYFVDARAWAPREPYHPLRESHKALGKGLAEFIKKTFLK